MIWTIILVSIPILFAILTNVISAWIEPTLKKIKIPTVIAFIIISLFTGLYLDRENITSKKSNSKKGKASILVDSNVVEDKKGNVYKIFKFNKKIWLAQNLNISSDDSYCYDGDDKNCKKFGKLYSYKSAMEACESLGEGWRLPKTVEIKDLLLSNNGGYTSVSKWGSETIFGDPIQAEKNMRVGGSVGFNALTGGGAMETDGFIGKTRIYTGINFYGGYWLSPDIGDAQNPYVYLIENSRILNRYFGSSLYYYSCRCLCDSIQ